MSLSLSDIKLAPNIRRRIRKRYKEQMRMEVLRICRTCGLQAFTYDDLQKFVKDSDSLYGRQNYCKKCRNEGRKPPKPSYLRKCRVCGFQTNTEAELELFRKCNLGLYGRRNLCNKCHNEKRDRQLRLRRLTEGFEKPIRCYFCGEEITKPIGTERASLITHSLDGNHENWNPTNKVPAHNNCHARYHRSGADRDERGQFKR